MLFLEHFKCQWLHVPPCLTLENSLWRSFLRDCATSRKVAGSFSKDVMGIFHWLIPSGRTVALGSTQPLTEMRTRNISWRGKRSRCVGLTTLPPSCADFLAIGSLCLLERWGPVQACTGTALPVGMSSYCFCMKENSEFCGRLTHGVHTRYDFHVTGIHRNSTEINSITGVTTLLLHILHSL
jgi:hypothetical protein